MADGHVTIDAKDWARIEVALAALVEMKEDLAAVKERLKQPVERACGECPDLKAKVQTLWEDRLRVIGVAIGTVAAGGGLGGLLGWLAK
jgi:hypothetical protein